MSSVDCFRAVRDRALLLLASECRQETFTFVTQIYLFLADPIDFSAPEFYKGFKQYGLNAALSRSLGIRREVPDSRDKMYVSPLTKLQCLAY